MPIEGVMTGPRNIHWMAGQAATLVWFEALDGGDPRKPDEFRDRMMMQADPVAGDAVEVTRLENRAFGTQYFQTPGLFATTEYDRDRRWITTNLHDLNHLGQAPRTIDDRSIRDRYGDPGRLVTMRDSAGFNVVRQMGDWGYRIGRGASPTGDLPFVDRQNIKTMEFERLWRCEEGELETPVDIVIDDQQDAPSLITVAESPTTPPNYWLGNLSGGDRIALTDFKDPAPQIRDIKKQLVKLRTFRWRSAFSHALFALRLPGRATITIGGLGLPTRSHSCTPTRSRNRFCWSMAKTTTTAAPFPCSRVVCTRRSMAATCGW